MDLKKELSLAIESIQRMWHGVDSEVIHKVLAECFKQGVVDGRLWIDDHALFRLSEILNDGEMMFPAKARGKKLGWDAKRHDALCIFEEFVSSGLTQLRNTVTQQYSFSCKADALTAHMKERHIFDVTPKRISSVQEKHWQSEYTGFAGDGCRSYGIVEKLSYSNSMYWKNDQAMDFDRQLFAAFYSHGIACAEQTNLEELLDVIKPIYLELLDTPHNCDNGESIMNSARESNIVKVLEQMKAPEFSSTEAYEQELLRDEQRKIELALETPEETAKRKVEFEQRNKNMMKSIFNPSEEDVLKTEQEEARYRSIIKEFPATIVNAI